MAKDSPWRIVANRANAEKSTGPRTPEGKEISKMNRLTHGLASPLSVLPFENREEYDAVLTSFTKEYSPLGPTEEALVKQIADAQWKLRRIEKLEHHVFDAILQNEPNASAADPFAAIAASLLGPGKSQSVLATLARYQGTLNRQFLTAVKELRRIQKERAKQTIEELTAALLHEINGTAEQAAETKIAYSQIAKDPTIIGRYNDTACEILAADYRISKRATKAARLAEEEAA